MRKLTEQILFLAFIKIKENVFSVFEQSSVIGLILSGLIGYTHKTYTNAW